MKYDEKRVLLLALKAGELMLKSGGETARNAVDRRFIHVKPVERVLAL